MRVIGNFFCFVLGGFLMVLGWRLIGIVALLTIVGMPWAKAFFVIGQFAFPLFGKEVVSRKDVSQKGDIGTGVLGIPFGLQHLKFAGIAFAPIGKTIVPNR